MAATQVGQPFHHPGWVYEEKVDGWRVLGYKDAAGGVRLVSRTGQSGRFAAAVPGLEGGTVKPDEVVPAGGRRRSPSRGDLP